MDQFDYYLEDDIINIYGGNFDLFQRIKDLIKSPIRLNYPPSYREFLQTYGGLAITDFWICKKPIQQAFDKLLNVISFGNWQRKKDELNYDNMFHLFGIARLVTNQYVLFEKNQVLNIGMVNKNIMKNCRSIYISPSLFQTSLKNIQISERRAGRLDLNVMHQRCLEDIGPEKMFLYRGDSTNCQHFIYNMFNSSGLMNNAIKEFVMQDAKTLVSAVPGIVQKFMNGATDIASLFDHVLYGAALEHVHVLSRNGGSGLFIVALVFNCF